MGDPSRSPSPACPHLGSLHFGGISILGVSTLGFFYARAGPLPGGGLERILSSGVSLWGRGHPRQKCGCSSSEDGKTSHPNLPFLCPQLPVVAPSTTPHWVALSPLSLGELQGPTSLAVGSLKQLRDAGCTCTSRGSHWMRTMTGEDLGLGSEVPTSRK